MKRMTLLHVLCALSLLLSSGTTPANEGSTSEISPGDDVLTMINVLSPEDGTQEELLALLQLAMEEEMSRQPGFLSANIHRSLDSDHVVNYAQWRNRQSVENVVKVIESGGAPNMAKVFSMAAPDFHPYRVTAVVPAR